MNKALMILGLAGLILGLQSTGPAFADSPFEKYNEYMKKYHEHLKEAYEEADDGDWDDYREEMEKAQKYLWKAQQYAPRHLPYQGEYYGGPPPFGRSGRWNGGYGYRGTGGPGYNHGSPHYRPYASHAAGCGCGSCRGNSGFFGLFR